MKIKGHMVSLGNKVTLSELLYSAEKVTNMSQLKAKNSVAYDFILKLEEGAK